MLSGELFDKIETLKEIEKIVKDNDLNEVGSFCELSNIIEYLSIYKKFGIYDKSIYGNINGYIRYGVSVGLRSEIPNIGKIDKELLLEISFPTGGYTFGSEYTVDYFNDFFNELQTVKPKYVDEMNNAIYYSADNAKEGYKHYNEVYDKYEEGYSSVVKELQIKELERKLKQLKG